MRIKKIKAVIFSLLLILSLNFVQSVDDYFIYGVYPPYDMIPSNPWDNNPCDRITGAGGYIDYSNNFKRNELGKPPKEYLFFTCSLQSFAGPHTAYIVMVETLGDSEKHPDNPLNRGPVAQRKFTYISKHYMGCYLAGHNNNFYVDKTGIYYGGSDDSKSKRDPYCENKCPSFGFCPGYATHTLSGEGLPEEKPSGCLIGRWDFNWNYLGCVLFKNAGSDSKVVNIQTLDFDKELGLWWVGTNCNDATDHGCIYRIENGDLVEQYRYPLLGTSFWGEHHDGLEIVGDYVFIFNMYTTAVLRARLNSQRKIDSSSAQILRYSTPNEVLVEGVGFGPNKHIWVSGWKTPIAIYELGGFDLLGVSTYPCREPLPPDYLGKSIISGQDFSSDPNKAWRYVAKENNLLSLEECEWTCAKGYSYDGEKCVTIFNNCRQFKNQNDCDNAPSYIGRQSVNELLGGNFCGTRIVYFSYGNCDYTIDNCRCFWENGFCNSRYDTIPSCPDGTGGYCEIKSEIVENNCRNFNTIKIKNTANWVGDLNHPMKKFCISSTYEANCPPELDFFTLGGFLSSLLLIVAIYFLMRKR